jgi:hypothetical protein
VFGGLVCDARNLRVCRGNSDFDIRHLITANGIYELPFGRGRRIGGNAPAWLNAIIGGWQISGILGARSGLPFNATTGAFPISLVVDSPAALNGGDANALRQRIHDDAESGTIQFFADPGKVFDPNDPTGSLLRSPRHGESGSRNILRGPRFWSMDTAVLKTFSTPWSEGQKLIFRWETYNAFNHHVFGLPNTDVSLPEFGQITGSASAPRVMQFALRYEF